MSMINNDRKIAALEKQMADAVAREDYEAAAKARDAIQELRGVVKASQPPPGSMGLGTNVPVVEPPRGWARPKKPDLMTNVKGRKR
jgi:hypothetical protein